MGTYSNEIEWFVNNKIPVFTVSFVGDANSSLLEKIAYDTNGEYHKANTASDILNIFSLFLNKINKNSTFFSYSSTISQNQKIDQYFYVDPNLDILNAHTAWLGSTVSLILTSPNGKTYSSLHNPINWTIGNNYNIVDIPNPEAGKWKAEFIGTRIPLNGEQFSFKANGKSEFKININLSLKNKGSINFEINDQNDIKWTKADISVELPSGTNINISDKLNTKKLSYWPVDGEGNYIFNFNLKGTTKNNYKIQRFFTKTVLIGKENFFYIAPIISKAGSFVEVNIGKKTGISVGMKCFVYDRKGNKRVVLAEGSISRVYDKSCLVEISKTFGSRSIEIGDILELDKSIWQSY
jgi:hypothetical protein